MRQTVRGGLVFLFFVVALGPLRGVPSADARGPATATTIQGTVRAGGKPVGGVTVAVRRLYEGDVDLSHRHESNELVADRVVSRLVRTWKDTGKKSKADAKGRFELAVDGEGVYAVRVQASGAEQVALVHVPDVARTVEVHFDVTKTTRRVEGELEIAQGHTFKGWAVLHWHAAGPARFTLMHMAAPKRLDGGGAFAFEGVAPGHAVITVVDEAGAVWSSYQVRGEPARIRVAPLPPLQVRGTVRTEDGAPVPNAEVAQARLPTAGRTDAKGNFEISMARRRARFVTVTAPGMATTTTEVAATPDARDAQVDVVLAPASKLTGTVQGGGKPLAGVRVECVVVPTISGRPEPKYALGRLALKFDRVTTTTDAKGRFAFDALAAGHYLVAVRAAAWVSSAYVQLAGGEPVPADDVITLAAGKAKDVAVPCVATGSIVGRVLSPRSKGVRGVQVVADVQTHPVSAVRKLRVVGGVVESGAGGRFRIDGLIPGANYRVVTSSLERSDAETSDIAVKSGQATPVELTVGDAGWLVVDTRLWPTKKPQANVALSLRDLREPRALVTRETPVWFTDEKGRARVGPIALGASKLFARGVMMGSAGEVAFEPLPPQGGTHKVTLDLDKGRAIAGRVRLPTGASMKYAKITVVRGDAAEFVRPTTSPDGRFRVSGLEPGRVRVRAAVPVNGQLFEGVAVGEIDDANVDIRLKAYRPGTGSGTWLVRVRGPDGAPVPRAGVFKVTYGSGSRAPTLRQRFEILGGGVAVFDHPFGRDRPVENPKQETWFNVFSASEDDEDQKLPAGEFVVGPLTSGGGVVDIKLLAPRTLTGRVVAPDGTPRGGIEVRAYLHAWDLPMEGTRRDRTARTDADGRFTFERLGAYPYRLTVVDPPAKVIPPAPMVVAKDQDDVKWVLRDGARAVVTVVDHAGAPVSAEVRAWRGKADTTPPPPPESESDELRARATGALRAVLDDVPAVVATTDAKGRATFHGLDPARWYYVQAFQRGEDMRALKSKMVVWRGKDTRLSLRRSRRIVGKVVTPSGEGVPGATVWLRTKSFPWLPAHGDPSAADGSFAVRLPPVEIMGQAKDEAFSCWAGLGDAVRPPEPGDPRWAKEVRPRPDRGPLTLVVDPGPGVRVEIEGWKDAWAPANLMLADLDAPEAETVDMTTSSARAAFFGVDPDRRYAVYVTSADGAWAGTVERATTSSLAKVTMRKALRVTGKAVLPADTPWRAYVIAAWNHLGFGVVGTIGRDGAVEVGGLLPGTWTVVVSGSFRGKDYFGQEEVSAGAKVTVQVAEETE